MTAVRLDDTYTRDKILDVIITEANELMSCGDN